MSPFSSRKSPEDSCLLKWAGLVHSVVAAVVLGFVSTSGFADEETKPNVLFISIDDLNDWIGCLGGHPQALTPNLDRLAESGVLFTNAHCPAPACNPSRTAIMTGISPHKSGLYENGQKMREILPDVELLPQYLRKYGYRAIGSGKLLHYFVDAPSWDDYFPEKETENPFPPTYYPEERPVNLPRGGPWQYVETDWAALPVSDEEFGGDWLISKWVGEQLSKEQEKPFFLACGIYRPHEPWFVPQKYFEPFPLDTIQLPPGYREDDLADLPPSGKRRGPNRYFEHIRSQGQWKQGIQGYLASIYFADAMLGRVLDALENGPHAGNTIVALWSDHGWHLGEKEHWQKFTGWRAATRVPLILCVPKGCSESLPEGTRAGVRSDQPVSLLSLFPTLCELAGVPEHIGNDGPSLVPLLEEEASNWPHVSLTFLGERGSLAVSGRRWRYIHYKNGDEELYDIAEDPYEWVNRAGDPAAAEKKEELKAFVPRRFFEAPLVSLEALPELTWVSAQSAECPPSNPDGAPFSVTFVNQSGEAVELFWMTREGGRKSYGGITPGGKRSQQTRPGAVWEIHSKEGGEALGHFVVGDRKAKAVVPTYRYEVRSDWAPHFRTSDHATFEMLGWTIHLHRQWWEENSRESRRALELMHGQFQRIVEAIPLEALAQLREVPIWINPPYENKRGGAEYHPGAKWLEDNGRNPAMAKSVEITNVNRFPFENRRMPYLMLHELAHAYHDQKLEGGFSNSELKAAYERARSSGSYDEVSRFDGNRMIKDKAYAMSNPMEYFAESTEAYFGKNDFFPFTREELLDHDPEMHELIAELWGVEE